MQARKKRILTIGSTVLGLLLMAYTCAAGVSQELKRVEVTGFPLSRGMSVKASFWNPFQMDFTAIAALTKDSLVRVELTPMVDATEYHSRSLDDPLNGGLTISRCMAVAAQLEHAGVPKEQIVFVRPDRGVAKGPQCRKVTITVTRVTAPPYLTRPQLDSVFAAQPKATPIVIERTIMQCQGKPSTYALWLGIGLTYNAFDKFVPLVQGQVGNRRLRFVADVSHSLYAIRKTYGNERLEVNYRLIACSFAYRPLLYGNVELTAGWQRSEEYSTNYGKYTRKYEGPEVGIRYTPARHIALQLLYAPGELSTFGADRVRWRNDNFRATIVVSTPIIGGGR